MEVKVSRSAVVFKPREYSGLDGRGISAICLLGPPKATNVQQRQEQCNGKNNRSTDNGTLKNEDGLQGMGTKTYRQMRTPPATAKAETIKS